MFIANGGTTQFVPYMSTQWPQKEVPWILVVMVMMMMMMI